MSFSKHWNLFLSLSESFLSLAQCFNVNLELLLRHFHWIEAIRGCIIWNLRICPTFLHRDPRLYRGTTRTLNIAIVELIRSIHHVLLRLPHIRQIWSYSDGAWKIIINIVIPSVFQCHLQWFHLIPQSKYLLLMLNPCPFKLHTFFLQLFLQSFHLCMPTCL